MTRDVIAIPVDMTVPEIAELFVRNGISGAPVLKANDHVVGMVSEADLVKTLVEPTHHQVRHQLPHRQANTRSARAVMTSPAVTVDAERSASHAATIMVARHIRRLPVLENGRLVGIVTRADLVRAFARDDRTLAQEIWSDVILRQVFVNPRLLAVTVVNGEVVLTGEVETRGKAQRLVEYVERVPGVTSVCSEVTWRRNERAPKGVPPARRV